MLSDKVRTLLPVTQALVLLGSALSTSFAAAETTVTLAIDCPSFDAESRAALESRAQTELLVKNAPGTFVVVCHGPSASLSWHPLVGKPMTATATLDSDSRASTERILESLDALLTEPVPVASAEPAPPVALAPSPAVAAPVAPPVPRLLLPAPNTHVVAPSNDTSATWPGLVVGAGTALELWQNTAALGPRARLFLPLPSRFEAGIAGTLLFTLRSPARVSGNLIRIAAGGGYGLDDAARFRVGADVFVDVISASANGAGSANKLEPGATFHATVALLTKPFRVEVGPTLSVHPATIRALLGAKPDGSDGTAVFQIHPFTAGFVLGMTAGPIR